MTSNAERAHAHFESAIGQEQGTGEWFEMTQQRIDDFAEVTEDRQFIHVDPEACKELSPWGVPIAHGFLTLSMLTHLTASIPMPPEGLEGIAMGVNYGFDKVRFVSPVKVGARIRATSALKAAELKDASTVQTTRTITVEIEGEDRPALVADWVTRMIYS
jgi:acyl dehydratase